MGKPSKSMSLRDATVVPEGLKRESGSSKRDRERSWTLKALQRMGAPTVDSLVLMIKIV